MAARSKWPREQVIHQIARHVHAHMIRSPSPFRDTVVAPRIRLKVEGLAQLNQPVDQSLRDLQVRVRLAAPVNDQQITLKALGEVNGGRRFVSCRRRPPGTETIDTLESFLTSSCHQRRKQCPNTGRTMRLKIIGNVFICSSKL